jgi:hypothetical protein
MAHTIAGRSSTRTRGKTNVKTTETSKCVVNNLKTVGDVKGIISANVRSNSEKLSAHSKTLTGPRNHGSTTKISIMDVPDEIRLKKRHDSNLRDGCEMYSFLFDMGGRIGAAPLHEVLAMEIPAFVRQGVHGAELQIDSMHIEDDDRWTNEIFVIVGKWLEEDAIFTWHPGPILKCLSDGICGDTAVRFVDGLDELRAAEYLAGLDN